MWGHLTTRAKAQKGNNMIRKCVGCKPHQQDRIHGEKMRVCNEFRDSNGNRYARCTVCGAEQAVGSKKCNDD
ncbi:MAG: hypothetical protein DRP45_11845 [Candidatus Zixiibacteriota bacterium]|nr:MAG: hypothetical protein DRP45_11845 [candidate division Zixibacteria bacterium]